MINTKLLKVSKRIIIILLIAVFSLSGIVACGGENITSSISQADNSGRTEPKTDLPYWDKNYVPTSSTKQTFPEDTYCTVYAPFVNWEDKSAVPAKDKITVSWRDSDTITQIWRKQIEGGKDNDGKRWFIRDANNYEKAPLKGSYYYFDKYLNIVYYRQGKGSLTVRKFRYGTVINYSGYGGITAGGETWGVGGVYETILTKKEIRDNNFNELNIFMGDEDMGEDRGNLEVLTINTGYSFDNNTEFGVSFYYTKGNKEDYTTENPVSGVRNLSWKPEYVNFKFFSDKTRGWHLSNHLYRQGWHE